MESILQFTVNDTSPTVSYSPDGSWDPCFTDIGCPNITQPLQQTPNGSSYHVTSQDGANLTLSWRGTSVRLLGSVAYLHCPEYTVLLDGHPVKPHPSPSQNTLAYIQNVTLQDHTVNLVVQNPDKDIGCRVNYTGAIIYVDDTAASYTSVSLNETQIKYNGSWSTYTYNGQFQHSSAIGDTASTSVQGLSFLLYGMTSPDSGSYSVSLTVPSNNNTFNRQSISNYTNVTLSARSPFPNPGALLFYAADLDPTISYNLTVTNQDGGDLFIRSDGFQVFQAKSSPSPLSSPSATPVSKMSKSTIAAIALAVVLFVIMAAFLLFYLLIYRPRRRRCREEVDALKAYRDENRNRTTIMQLDEARISQSSSYRRRLARIISMIAPTEMSKRPSWKADLQHQQQLSPLSPASTHKSDYILEISRRPSEKPDDRRSADPVRQNDLSPTTEEGGMIFVHVPTSTLESEPQRSADPRGEENNSVILHHRLKSSPEATIPVSPSVSSNGGTQSRSRDSQNSSRFRSGRFSIPFSLSIPYVRTRSEDGNGNGGFRDGRRSRMDNLRRIEGGVVGDGKGSDENSLSTIVFAEIAKDPNSAGKVKKEKMWDIRRAVRSLVSGLSVGKRWSSARASAKAGDVIYPFTGVSSTTTPSHGRTLTAGGGLLIIGRERESSGGEAADDASPKRDSWREGNNGVQQSSGAATDITPLSYATRSRSRESFPAGEVSPDSETGGTGVEDAEPSPPLQRQQQPSYPPSPHPYAAAALISGPEDVSAIQRTQTVPSTEGSRQRPLTAPAPTKVGFRQLPVIPKDPSPVAHSPPSRPRPHTTSAPVSDNVTGHSPTTITGAGGRTIRALPPVPVPSVQIASTSVERALEVPATQKSSPTEQSAVQDDAMSLLPPYQPPGSQPASDSSSHSTEESSLKTPFLNVRDVSPFQVNFQLDGGQSQEERRNKSPGASGSRQTRPTLNIPSSSSAVHHSPPNMTPRTAKSTAQYSFLDFSTSSSSSNKDGSTREKSEPSPVAEVPPSVPPLPPMPTRSLDEPSRIEDRAEADTDDHSRRTFGQKRRSSSGSFYYVPADNMSLPSPSASTHTHQTYQTYQTSQSQEPRPTSQSYQRRRHASWRATFGGRIDSYIPEEATPSDSSPPIPLPEGGSPMDPQPISISASASQGSPRSLPEPVQEASDTQPEGRASYMSTSSGGHAAHIHPFSVGLPSRAHAPRPQIEPTSPGSTEDVSASSPIQFRAGGIRRTSSGDVQPVTYHRPSHTRDNGGSNSSGSGDLRQPRHPFSIP